MFYWADAGLMAVGVDLSNGFRAEVPQVLFELPCSRASAGASYDVSPDGERFVMISAALDDSPVVLVTNWFTELRERMDGN